jgi:C1A family cysteine protease
MTKYLLIFLVVSTSAFCDVNTDLTIRAIQEKWTFDFQVPAHPYATGLVRKASVRKHAKYSVVKALTTLPAHFDLTPGLTPVEDQGMCGGCWAFGTVGVIENFPFISTGTSVPLSQENMLDCDTVSQGCNGGDFDGFDWAKNGIASAATYPFTSGTSGNNGSCQSNIAAAAKVVDWSFIAGSETAEPTLDQIKTALYTSKAPIAVGIYASNDLQAYTGGIFNACTQGELDHMVDIVGWDDTDNDWIVRNSWGTSFGESGYFRIVRTDSTGAKCLSIGTESAMLSNASLVN